MADLRKYLIPSELPVVVTRRHWASLLKGGSLCAAAFIAGLLLLGYGSGAQLLGIVAVVVILGAVVAFLVLWAQWAGERFIITDRRVLLVYGIMTQRVGIMPLSKVTDLTYERSLIGRILGYGAFIVESAGQNQAFNRIEYLPKPDRLYHDVSLLLFPARRSWSGPPQEDHPTTPLPRER